MTGPQPLPKRVLHREWSFVSFPVQHSLISLKSPSSCSRLPPRLPVTSILPAIFPSITRFQMQFLLNMWPVWIFHELHGLSAMLEQNTSMNTEGLCFYTDKRQHQIYAQLQNELWKPLTSTKGGRRLHSSFYGYQGLSTAGFKTTRIASTRWRLCSTHLITTQIQRPSYICSSVTMHVSKSLSS
jgi:hypothetical protein